MKNADGVFHQAALGSVEESWKHPEEYHCVNVVGTENIFKHIYHILILKIYGIYF